MLSRGKPLLAKNVWLYLNRPPLLLQLLWKCEQKIPVFQKKNPMFRSTKMFNLQICRVYSLFSAAMRFQHQCWLIINDCAFSEIYQSSKIFTVKLLWNEFQFMSISNFGANGFFSRKFHFYFRGSCKGSSNQCRFNSMFERFWTTIEFEEWTISNCSKNEYDAHSTSVDITLWTFFFFESITGSEKMWQK